MVVIAVQAREIEPMGTDNGVEVAIDILGGLGREISAGMSITSALPASIFKEGRGTEANDVEVEGVVAEAAGNCKLVAITVEDDLTLYPGVETG